mmetsp:Transcript_127890/g.409653  ORF Transcript_127890/g.409653 Transcript_127890/m.409653 type:complete len:408 (-) Transcript_127890:1295-2518(-)
MHEFSGASCTKSHDLLHSEIKPLHSANNSCTEETRRASLSAEASSAAPVVWTSTSCFSTLRLNSSMSSSNLQRQVQRSSNCRFMLDEGPPSAGSALPKDAVTCASRMHTAPLASAKPSFRSRHCCSAAEGATDKSRVLGTSTCPKLEFATCLSAICLDMADLSADAVSNSSLIRDISRCASASARPKLARFSRSARSTCVCCLAMTSRWAERLQSFCSMADMLLLSSSRSAPLRSRSASRRPRALRSSASSASSAPQRSMVASRCAKAICSVSSMLDRAFSARTNSRRRAAHCSSWARSRSSRSAPASATVASCAARAAARRSSRSSARCRASERRRSKAACVSWWAPSSCATQRFASAHSEATASATAASRAAASSARASSRRPSARSAARCRASSRLRSRAVHFS